MRRITGRGDGEDGRLRAPACGSGRRRWPYHSSPSTKLNLKNRRVLGKVRTDPKWATALVRALLVLTNREVFR